jgi:acetyl esterase/lipase
MLDDRTAARCELDNIAHRVWDNRSNRIGWSSYLGHEPGAPVVADYAVAARLAVLDGLPPTRIGVGDIDLFFEEDHLYCERLTAAGVPCEFDGVPMAPHGFETLVPRAQVSRDFERRNDGFIRRYLGIPS